MSKKRETKPKEIRQKPPRKPPAVVGTLPSPSEEPGGKKSSLEQAVEELQKPDANMERVADLLTRDD